MQKMDELQQIYRVSLQQIQQGMMEQGIAGFSTILSHRKAKLEESSFIVFSVLLSLGETYQTINKQRSLEYYENALALSEASSVPLMNNKEEKECQTLTTMASLAAELGLKDKQTQFLEKCRRITPRHRSELIIDQSERSLGSQRRAKDSSVMDQQVQIIEKVQFQDDCVEIIDDSPVILEKKEEFFQTVSAIRVRINLSQGQQQMQRYSLWENILTICYVFLKCKTQRNFTNKAYLNRYLNTEDWKQFMNFFDPLRTEIQLQFYYNQSQTPSDLPQTKQYRYGTLVKSISEAILEARYRDIRKEMIKYQDREKYSCFAQYFSEQLKTRGFKTDLLDYLKEINEEEFKNVYQRLSRDKDSKSRENMFQKIQYGTQPNSWNLQASSFQQEKMISWNKKANMQIQSCFGLQLSIMQNEDSTNYNNAIHLAQELVNCFIAQSLRSRFPLINNYNLRAILLKIITQCIILRESSLRNICDQQMQENVVERKSVLVEMLNHKLLLISAKMPKDESFAQHQLTKIRKLAEFIKRIFNNSNIRIPDNLFPLEQRQLRPLCELAYQQLKFYSIQGEKMGNITVLKNQLLSMYLQLQHISNQNELSQNRISLFLDDTIHELRRKSLRIDVQTEQIQIEEQSLKEKIKKSVDYMQAGKHLSLLRQKREESDASQIEKYFNNTIALLEKYFIRLEKENKEINVREVKIWTEQLELKEIVQQVYNRFIKDQSIKGGGQIDKNKYQQYTKLLFHLIKLYLLCAFEDSDVSLRIIFFITSLLLKDQSQQIKNQIAPKILPLYSHLIRYRPLPQKVLKTIRKKLYVNIISKNLKSLLNRNCLEGNDKEKKEISRHVQSTLREIYICSDFQPKKIDDCIGVLVIIGRSLEKMKENGAACFAPELIQPIKLAHEVLRGKRQEFAKYCPAFLQIIKDIPTLLAGNIKRGAQNSLKRILKGDEKICECCSSLCQINPLYLQCISVLSLFFEFKPYQYCEQQPQWKQKPYKYHFLDEQYAYQYLLLNPKNPSAWQTHIRVNMNKIFIYYDSFVGKSIKGLEGKLQETRRLINLAVELQGDKELARHCEYWIQMLDIMKIREREYRMVLKDLQGAGESSARECRQATKRYKQGLKNLLSKMADKYKQDVRVRFLRVIELKLRLAWVNLEKQYKQQDKKDVTIIELEDYQTPYEKVFRPTKLRQQLLEILADIKSIIHDLPRDPRRQQVAWLQQALIMQAYIFLYRSMQFKLQKIINRLCEVIRVCSKTDQCRKLKQMQSTFNQLEYTANLFLDSDFISPKEAYRIRGERVATNKLGLEDYEIMFQNTFAPKSQPQSQMPKCNLQTYLAKYQRASEARAVIEIQDDVSQSGKSISLASSESHFSFKPLKKYKQGGHWQLGKGRAQQRLRTHFIPEAHIDVGKYFYGQLKQYMIDNQSAATRFNAIHSVVGSFSFHTLLQRLTKIMQELYRVFAYLLSGETGTGCKKVLQMVQLTISQLVLRYSGNWQKANDLIKDQYNLHSDQIVFIHPDLVPAPSTSLLTDYYRRSMVVQLIKHRFIKHLFTLFNKSGAKENLVFLIGKLLRLSEGKIETQVPKDCKVGVKIHTSNEQQLGKCEVKFYYYLFEQGTSEYLNLLRKESRERRLPGHDERQLLKFRDEIKARMGRDETNFYYNRILGFKNEYEKKYSRIKEPKKDRSEVKKEVKQEVKQEKKKRQRRKKKGKGVATEVKTEDTAPTLKKSRSKNKKGEKRKKGSKKPNQSQSQQSQSNIQDMKIQQQIS